MVERLENTRKYSVQQLVLEKFMLDTLMSVIPDGVILLDTKFRVIFFNQVTTKAFDFFKNCTIGVLICNYLPHYLNSKFIPVLKKMVSATCCNNKNTHYQQTFIVFDYNTSKTLKFTLTTIMNQQKDCLTAIAIVVQDITKQVKISEAKGLFISNISHELRTPLFNIQSFLETLLDYNDILTDKQKVEFLTIANCEIKRLTCLVNDILNLSRLESGFHFSVDSIDLGAVVKLVIQTAQLRSYDRKIKLIGQLQFKAIVVKGSYNLLVQVLSNLVANSVKFTQFYGRIALRIYVVQVGHALKKFKQKYNKVRIEIIDEGKGIGQSDQSKIFDRFVRIEKGIHTIDSTGLGLSIVKNIIEKHHSQVCLYSELEVGSSFWFDLYLYN